MMITRKQFLRSLAGIGAGALAIGCSKNDGAPEPVLDAPPMTPIDAPPAMPDGPQPDAPTTNACASTTTAITANHGHAAMVPAVDVMAGVEKAYNIKGASGHPHTVTVTAAMFAMLKAGSAVTVTSSEDANHTHDVTITCA